MDNLEKMYILPLKWGTWRKRLYFGGKADEQTEVLFKESFRGLGELGDNATNAQDFFAKAIEHYKKAGFYHVKR